MLNLTVERILGTTKDHKVVVVSETLFEALVAAASKEAKEQIKKEFPQHMNIIPIKIKKDF